MHYNYSRAKTAENSKEKMTIDEIYRDKKISVRSYHVCKYNDLHTIQDLKEYYFKHKSFDKIKHCGRKSNEELIEICKRHQEVNLKSKAFELQKEGFLKTVVSELTKTQIEVIDGFILINTNNLSVRSKNAILFYLKGNLKIKNFAKKILLLRNFTVKNIKNVGVKSIPELDFYIAIIKDFLIEVSKSKDKKNYLRSFKKKFLIQETFSVSKIPNKILESESIFLFTDFLLNQNALFNEVQTFIAKETLKIFGNASKLTFNDIVLKANLSAERVKQIRKICIDGLFYKLLFTQNFNDDLLQKYGICTNSNQIEINSYVVNTINITNKINFSREFITYILSAYLHDSFLLVGNIEDVLQVKYFNTRNRHNWKNLYLIKKEISSEIDFSSLVNDINNRMNERIKKTYSFNFKGYLSMFLINNNIDILDLVLPIAEKIVNKEFKIHLGLDKNIFFKRNTIKQVYEYSYEALEQLGKSSKVKEVFEKVIELHPNYKTKENKIRASMKRKNGFVPIGRKSVFGLKKWEIESDDFKGGTIRNIVEEFLNNYDRPKHISEITTYVLKFRSKSNQNSIWANIKLDKSGIYRFFEGSKIGLSNKYYDDSFTQIIKSNSVENKTWEEKFEALLNFIKKENRLPYSTGSLKGEKKLYRWFNLQKRKRFDINFKGEREKLITEINNKFLQTNKK